MQTWLRLKLELLPCISQEADKVGSDYQGLIERFRKGDKQVIQDILLLQASIRSRIDEFDKFYEVHFADPRIAYFERTKMKLRKLLYIPVETPEQEQSPETDFKEVDPKAKEYEYEENKDNYAPQVDLVSREQPRPKASPYRQERTSKSPVITKSPAGKSKSPAPVGRDTMSKARAPVATNARRQEEPKKKTANAPAQEDEMVFTIRMTKKEYSQYMQTMKTKPGGK